MGNNRKNIVIESVEKILLPLVKLALRHGVTYREFSNLGKRIFFKAGQSILQENAKGSVAITDSKLSMLTGLHRKDITQFNSMDMSHDIPTSARSSAAVIATWLTNSRFVKDGVPKPLPYSSKNKSPSFTVLTETVSNDVRPKTYLDELVRLGLVEVDADNIVHLKQNAFVPSGDFVKKLDFFTRHVHDHLSASADNIESSQPVYFDRSAYHSHLSPESIEQLRLLVDKEGMNLLKKVYAQADSLAGKDVIKQDKEKRHRMTLGVYFYSPDEAADD